MSPLTSSPKQSFPLKAFGQCRTKTLWTDEQFEAYKRNFLHPNTGIVVNLKRSLLLTDSGGGGIGNIPIFFKKTLIDFLRWHCRIWPSARVGIETPVQGSRIDIWTNSALFASPPGYAFVWPAIWSKRQCQMGEDRQRVAHLQCHSVGTTELSKSWEVITILCFFYKKNIEFVVILKKRIFSILAPAQNGKCLWRTYLLFSDHRMTWLANFPIRFLRLKESKFLLYNYSPIQ